MAEEPGWQVAIVGEAEVDPRTLTPHPLNPKIHTPEQDAVVGASLARFGWLERVMVNEVTGHLLNGHERVALALARGETTVPVSYVRVPAEQEGEVLLTLDPSGQLWRTHVERWAQLQAAAQTESPTLRAFFRDQAAKYGVGAGSGARPTQTGGEDETPTADPTEVLRQAWGVEDGQRWQLGAHRLRVGDGTDMAAVAALLAGEQAACIFTDPPYNCASHGRNYAADAPTQAGTYASLARAAWDHDFAIAPLWPVLEQVMAPDCVVYVCTSRWLIPEVWAWMDTWASFCSYVVWCKTNPAPALAKRHWTWATELIAYAVRGRHVCHFPAEGHALNWWDLASPAHTTPHPTEKPVALVAKALAFSSDPGALVYDGFLGSGTTLIACEQLQRRCVGCERDPGYAAVILQRWADLTGGTPVRVA